MSDEATFTTKSLLHKRLKLRSWRRSDLPGSGLSASKRYFQVRSCSERLLTSLASYRMVTAANQANAGYLGKPRRNLDKSYTFKRNNFTTNTTAFRHNIYSNTHDSCLKTSVNSLSKSARLSVCSSPVQQNSARLKLTAAMHCGTCSN